MKKLLLSLLFGIGVFVLTGCGGDEEDDAPLTITPGSLSMFFDGTQQLKASGATSWETGNDFIASVDQNGLVEARHVGSTEIIASNGSKMGKCSVTIVPKYKLYDTPILKWKASKSEIKAAETHTLSSDNDSELAYLYDNGTVKTAVIYVFEDGGLEVIFAFNDEDYFPMHAMYLLERYQPAGVDDGMYVFMDAMDINKSKTLISLNYQDISKTTVALAMYTNSSSIITRYGEIDDVKERLSKFGDFLKLLD